MSIHSISTFIGAFQGGTRPNRFKITGSSPAGNLFFDTHCVASSLPESIVGSILIPFRGRIYKFPGDRQYNDWAVTILDDTGDKATWKLFHDWSELFNSHVDNVAAEKTQETNYCRDLTITHLDHSSSSGALKQVLLQNAWPSIVGPVTLDMSAANTLSQFQVTIAYTHFQVITVPGADVAGPPAPQ